MARCSFSIWLLWFICDYYFCKKYLKTSYIIPRSSCNIQLLSLNWCPCWFSLPLWSGGSTLLNPTPKRLYMWAEFSTTSSGLINFCIFCNICTFTLQLICIVLGWKLLNRYTKLASTRAVPIKYSASHKCKSHM